MLKVVSTTVDGQTGGFCGAFIDLTNSDDELGTDGYDVHDRNSKRGDDVKAGMGYTQNERTEEKQIEGSIGVDAEETQEEEELLFDEKHGGCIKAEEDLGEGELPEGGTDAAAGSDTRPTESARANGQSEEGERAVGETDAAGSDTRPTVPPNQPPVPPTSQDCDQIVEYINSYAEDGRTMEMGPVGLCNWKDFRKRHPGYAAKLQVNNAFKPSQICKLDDRLEHDGNPLPGKVRLATQPPARANGQSEVSGGANANVLERIDDKDESVAEEIPTEEGCYDGFRIEASSTLSGILRSEKESDRPTHALMVGEIVKECVNWLVGTGFKIPQKGHSIHHLFWKNRKNLAFKRTFKDTLGKINGAVDPEKYFVFPSVEKCSTASTKRTDTMDLWISRSILWFKSNGWRRPKQRGGSEEEAAFYRSFYRYRNNQTVADRFSRALKQETDVPPTFNWGRITLHKKRPSDRPLAEQTPQKRTKPPSSQSSGSKSSVQEDLKGTDVRQEGGWQLNSFSVTSTGSTGGAGKRSSRRTAMREPSVYQRGPGQSDDTMNFEHHCKAYFDKHCTGLVKEQCTSYCKQFYNSMAALMQRTIAQQVQKAVAEQMRHVRERVDGNAHRTNIGARANDFHLAQPQAAPEEQQVLEARRRLPTVSSESVTVFRKDIDPHTQFEVRVYYSWTHKIMYKGTTTKDGKLLDGHVVNKTPDPNFFTYQSVKNGKRNGLVRRTRSNYFRLEFEEDPDNFLHIYPPNKAQWFFYGDRQGNGFTRFKNDTYRNYKTVKGKVTLSI